MPKGQCEWLLYPESPAVMSFGFYTKMKGPGALPGGNGTVCITVSTVSVGNLAAF